MAPGTANLLCRELDNIGLRAHFSEGEAAEAARCLCAEKKTATHAAGSHAGVGSRGGGVTFRPRPPAATGSRALSARPLRRTYNRRPCVTSSTFSHAHSFP